LLGRKVSIRLRLHGDPQHPFSEAIGVVMSVETEGGEEFVSLVTKRAETVRIASSDVLAASVFPA